MVQVCRGYIRVSTEEQAEEGYSLAAQEATLREHAQRHGWELVRVYADEGISAKDMNRPALQQLLADMKKGDILLVYKLDRLSRSVRDTEHVFATLDKRGASFVSAAEPHLSTAGASGIMVRQITAVFAEHYRRQLGENVRHGISQAVRQGKWYGGPLPYAYDYADGQLVPNDKAAVVRRIFAEYLSGSGIRSIAQRLNEDGIRTKTGHLWSAPTVSRIIRQPIYCGRISYGKQRGRRVDSWGSHEPIITPDQFDRAQDVLARRKTIPPRTVGNMYPLTGIALCSSCGAPIHGFLSKGRRKYRCQRRSLSGTCRHPIQCADRVEADLVAVLAGYADSERVTRFLETPQPVQDTAAMQGRLVEIERRLARLDAAYESDALDLAEYTEKRKPLRLERQMLEELLSQQEPESIERQRQDMLEVAQRIDALWPELTAAERKELLHSLRLTVLVLPDYRVDIFPSRQEALMQVQRNSV